MNIHYSLCFNLTEDYYGKESSGVIHYAKFTDSHIGILSFGETHNLFPQENDKKIF